MRSFMYEKPTSLAHALSAIANGGPGTRFVAGGTTLYDLMKLDVETPTTLVDITGLKELATFDTSRRDELVFGALAPMRDVSADPTLVRDYPALSEALWRAASQQLRNMATVGGNLLQRTRCAYFRGGEPYACNKRRPGSGCAAIGGLDRGHAVLGASGSCIALYPGDWAVALVAFDARIDTLSPRGERTIPVEWLHREPGNTPHIEFALAPDELIVRIRVPVTPLGRGSTYHKIRDRESYAFALASAAVGLSMAGGTVLDARVALGGVATRPWRARETESALVGRPLTPAAAEHAAVAAFAKARVGRSNAYKIQLGVRTITEALMTARQRAERS
jgi:xanthine dehydrogenase YagS FAD-binding subunit